MVAELPPNENMVIEDREIPGPEDTPSVGVRIYRPKAVFGVLPGIFFIHGGGMIMGSVEGDNLKATELCEAIQAVVVSVEYRLAPEHPFPAALDDSYSVSKWVVNNAWEEFGTRAIVIGGESAGAYLALMTLIEARDSFERIYLSYQLAKLQGSMTRLAERSGLERTHLYRKIRQLGMELQRGVLKKNNQ